MEQKEIEAALGSVLDQRDSIDKHTHHAHHEYVSQLLLREERRDIFRDKIRAQIGGWALISLLSAIGYAAWQGFQTLVHK